MNRWYRFTDPTGAQRYEPIYAPDSMSHRPWVADPSAAATRVSMGREARLRARRAGPAEVTAADAPEAVLRAGQDPAEWARQTNASRAQVRGAAEFFGADPMAGAAQANPALAAPPAAPPAGELPPDRPDFRPIDEIDRTPK